MGAKHQPSYRIVVADSRSPRDGRYIDQVGFYDPLTNPATIRIDETKAVDWLRRGAEPTETVAILLGKKNIDPLEARGSKKPRPAPRAASPAKPKAAAEPEGPEVTSEPAGETEPASE
jgi:small subunit ribosomal protein S16